MHALETIDVKDKENIRHIITATIIIMMVQKKRNSLIILKWICSKTHLYRIIYEEIVAMMTKCVAQFGMCLQC